MVAILFQWKYFRSAILALFWAESGGTMLYNRGYLSLLDRSEAVEAYET